MSVLTHEASPLRKQELAPLKERMKELTETGFDLTNVRPMLVSDEPPGSGFWLLDLPVGCVFLARPKPNNHQMKRSLELTEYGVFNQTGKSTVLLVRQPDHTLTCWVDTKLFSNEVEFFEILRTQDKNILSMVAQYNKEKEENECSDIRPIHSDGLPDDAGHQV